MRLVSHEGLEISRQCLAILFRAFFSVYVTKLKTTVKGFSFSLWYMHSGHLHMYLLTSMSASPNVELMVVGYLF